MSTNETSHIPGDPADERSELPGFPTWRSVYLLVVVVFIAYVALLVALSKMFA